MVLNMFPRFASNYSSNRFFVNSEKPCDLFLFESLCSVHRLYSYYISLIKFCLWVFTTEKTATFLNHIFHVVVVTTKKQVIRIYTSWIVALMTNKATAWYWSKMNFPRNSAGNCVSSGVVFSAANTKPRISMVINLSGPFPTSVKRNKNHLVHESFFIRNKLFSHLGCI